MERPKAVYNRFDARAGKYNLCDPSQLSTEVRFNLRETSPLKIKSFDLSAGSDDVTDEFNGLTTLEAAQKCLDYHERFIYSSSLDRAKELVAYLTETDFQDQIDETGHKIAMIDFQIEELAKKKKQLQSGLEDLKAMSEE